MKKTLLILILLSTISLAAKRDKIKLYYESFGYINQPKHYPHVIKRNGIIDNRKITIQNPKGRAVLKVFDVKTNKLLEEILYNEASEISIDTVIFSEPISGKSDTQRIMAYKPIRVK